MSLDLGYDVIALLIMIILTIRTLSRHFILDFKDKIFSMAVRVSVLYMALDFFNMSATYFGITAFDGIRPFLVGIHIVLCGLITYLLFVYIVSVLFKFNNFKHIIYYIAFIPEILLLILTIINSGNNKMFCINQGEVIIGPWYGAIYILIILYSGASLLVSLYGIKRLQKRNAYIFAIVPIIGVVGSFISSIYNEFDVIDILLSFMYLLIYIFYQLRIVSKDNLTRLPNLDSFWNMIEYRIANKRSMDIVLITLDDFKLVNQEFGYFNGNKFISAIADFIVDNSPKDCVVRYSGDEFAAIFDKSEKVDINEWTRMVFNRFENPWHVNNLKYTISVSICTLEYPTVADSSEGIVSLLEYTNSYAKKNKKGSIISCDDKFKIQMDRRYKIAAFLKKVIDEKKMNVFYQPIYNVSEGRYTIAEALFRLEDEELGDISPYEFLPIAEEAGYVSDIGYILIEKVCSYINTFRDKSAELPIISVNFTRQQLLYDGALDRILDILEDNSVPTSCLAIELPEESIAVNYTKVADKIKEFSNVGIRIVLDGFGTGFSDLSHVLELPFCLIKINRRLMWEAEKNDSIYLLVSALTAVFEENGMKILAEGIETERHKEIADLLFMNYLQGYYFCMPMNDDGAMEYFLRDSDITDEDINSIENQDIDW